MNNCKPRMQKTVSHLAEQLAGIRTGTISLGLIETVRVVCQGSSVPIRRLGQQGDRILITPFDKAVVPALVRAINEARLNAYALNPSTASVSIPSISVPRSPGTSRSWARTPRSPSGRSGRRHASGSKSRGGGHSVLSRRRPMRREPRLYVLHESLRELCPLEPILFRAVMG